MANIKLNSLSVTQATHCLRKSRFPKSIVVTLVNASTAERVSTDTVVIINLDQDKLQVSVPKTQYYNLITIFFHFFYLPGLQDNVGSVKLRATLKQLPIPTRQTHHVDPV